MTLPMKRPAAATIRIWLLPVPGRVPNALYECLDATERARAARFLGTADRSAFVAAHALVRALLASSGDRAPADWSFTVDGHGKPRVAVDGDTRPPTFNISHTPGLVAAVADPAGRAAGIDVEACARRIDSALASRILTADERARFDALDPVSARGELLQRWVLKEALAKATGRGIALPFTRIHCERLSPPAVSFEPEDGLGYPREWHLESWCAEGTHRVAVAVRHGDGPMPKPLRRTVGVDELRRMLRVD